MSEKKKDLKAFLSKQSKKGKKPAAAVADPEKVLEEETKTDAEVIKQPVEEAKKIDSDEEVDDAEVTGMDLGDAKIKEMKDIKQDNQQDEIEKKGYGFDESAKAQSLKAKDSVITRNTTNKGPGSGDITFGGSKPKFGRKKATNQIDGFDEGLEDIDDDGKMIKKNRGSKNTNSANQGAPSLDGASGGREFINFGSKARDPNQKDNNMQEESKEDNIFGSKATGVKPTFKRREPREFKNTNNDEEIRPAYDFKVSFKSHNDQENGDNRERRHRDQKDKGVPLDTFNKKSTGDDDDDFTFVTGKQKRTAPKKNNKDSDDDNNDGFKIERGARSGRGGFFKNSKKAE